MNIEELIFKAASLLKENSNFEKLISYLFLIYTRLENNLSIDEIIEYVYSNESKEIRGLILNNYSQGEYEEFDCEIVNKYDKDLIADLIINVNQYFHLFKSNFPEDDFIPDSVVSLGLHAVDLSTVSSAINFCCGLGTNIIKMADMGIKDITGIELNRRSAVIAEIRARIYTIENKGYRMEIINNSVFRYSQENLEEKYDLVTMQMPWGLKGLSNELSYWETDYLKKVKIGRCSDWYFMVLAMQHLSKEGKAICLVTKSIESLYPDREIRKKFIKEGYINKIIQLPTNLLHNTSVASLLMVLSFGNTEIEFIDASDLYSNKGRLRFFSEEDIWNILSNNNTNKKKVKTDIVIAEDRLLPAYYGMSEIENSIELGNVAQIIRGQNYKKSDLDTLFATSVSEYKLIRTSHIEDGVVLRHKCESLTELPEKYVKLTIGDILITRVGSNRAVAIYRGLNADMNEEDYELIYSESYEQMDEEVMIADQSLLIVRVDKNKINPYFLLAYFMSDLGEEQLSAAYSQSGAGISQISVTNLKKLKVPSLDINKQEKIAKLALDHIKEITKNKKKLDFLLRVRTNEISDCFYGGKWFV